MAGIAFLVAIPLGVAAELADWGQMPERFELAFFFYAWVFAVVSHLTRPVSEGAHTCDKSISK